MFQLTFPFIRRSILSLHEGRYPVEKGLMNAEAVALFRRFYSRENTRAPEAKRKRKGGEASSAVAGST